MKGGPDNPLGARAMYLGSSLYRIHGSNEPETIGQAVSSGCFRLLNDDVIDLYGRVKVGAKVVPGTIVRSADHRRIDFRISDGTTEYPVTYTGTVPDTFTDANDIEVVVEGRLQTDGVLHASDVLAKCGSRYESVPQQRA
jgi:hypothetical protein